MKLVNTYFHRVRTFIWYSNNDNLTDIQTMKQLLICSKFIVHFMFAIKKCWHLDNNSVHLFHKSTLTIQAIATFQALTN